MTFNQTILSMARNNMLGYACTAAAAAHGIDAKGRENTKESIKYDLMPLLVSMENLIMTQ
jgi:hypothetical protein